MTSLIRTLFFWALVLTTAIVAVANRHPVALSLDPFNSISPAVVFDVKLFWVILAAALAGLLLGGLASFLAQAPVRKALRDAEERILRLEREVEVAQKLIAKPPGRAVQVA